MHLGKGSVVHKAIHTRRAFDVIVQSSDSIGDRSAQAAFAPTDHAPWSAKFIGPDVVLVPFLGGFTGSDEGSNWNNVYPIPVVLAVSTSKPRASSGLKGFSICEVSDRSDLAVSN